MKLRFKVTVLLPSPFYSGAVPKSKEPTPDLGDGSTKQRLQMPRMLIKRKSTEEKEDSSGSEEDNKSKKDVSMGRKSKSDFSMKFKNVRDLDQSNKEVRRGK